MCCISTLASGAVSHGCICDLTARRETHGGDAAGGAALRHQSRHQHQNQPGGAAGRLQPRQPH